MLSKIISENKTGESSYSKFLPPTDIEILEIIEKRVKKKERDTFIEENKEDLEKAARTKADEILAIAQKKYKSLELEAETLKIKAEIEIRKKLTDEFDAKLDEAIKKINQNFNDSLKDISLLKRMIYENSEKKLIDLVFQITGKVIDGEIKTNPEIVIDMLKKGFEKVENSEKFEIKINPLDFEILSENKKKMDGIARSGAEIKFIKSDKVERGGCIIKTEMGEVIAEPSKQLETIKKEIFGA
jgi:flagellar assembly protein FliH